MEQFSPFDKERAWKLLFQLHRDICESGTAGYSLKCQSAISPLVRREKNPLWTGPVNSSSPCVKSHKPNSRGWIPQTAEVGGSGHLFLKARNPSGVSQRERHSADDMDAGGSHARKTLKSNKCERNMSLKWESGIIKV